MAQDRTRISTRIGDEFGARTVTRIAKVFDEAGQLDYEYTLLCPCGSETKYRKRTSFAYTKMCRVCAQAIKRQQDMTAHKANARRRLARTLRQLGDDQYEMYRERCEQWTRSPLTDHVRWEIAQVIFAETRREAA